MELKIQNITKRYRDKTAVDDVSITLTPGVWGLLGANGAGKTTLMRMLAGILRPSSGRILCDGVEIGTLGAAYREKLGYLPQEFGFYPEFTVQDYLEYMAALKGLPRTKAARQIDALLERVSLTEVRRKKIIKLSGGMKRRVGIAQALLNDPEILILDEPTAGLDPGERVRFRNLLSEFAQERIVLISTHIVSDVDLYVDNFDDWAFDSQFTATLTENMGKSNLSIYYAQANNIKAAKKQIEWNFKGGCKCVEKDKKYFFCWKTESYLLYGVPKLRNVIDDNTTCLCMSYYLRSNS